MATDQHERRVTVQVGVAGRVDVRDALRFEFVGDAGRQVVGQQHCAGWAHRLEAAQLAEEGRQAVGRHPLLGVCRVAVGSGGGADGDHAVSERVRALVVHG